MVEIPSFTQLKQRKVVQWAIAYLAGAWVLLQVLDLLGESFGWPRSVERVATVLLAAGFVATLIIGWHHAEKGRQRVTPFELIMIAALTVAAGVGAVVVARSPDAVAAPNAAASSLEFEEGALAVLPFVNRSADVANEWFSDGITEEIIATLSRLPGVQVRARSSSFAFKGKDLPVQDIARQLRVSHILEGSVQRSADRVRISAQLLDARSDRHLWSQTFDRDIKDLFAVEDEISQAIAAALRVRIASTSSDYRPAARTSNPKAHELYLQGRYLLTHASESGMQEVSKLFEQAVRLDPNYAAAHAGLAEAFLLSTPAQPSPRMIAKARAAVRRALDLDEQQPDAYAVLGAILLWHDWDLTGSEQALRRALELNPNAGNARDYYAWVLQLRGDMAGAVRMVEEAVRLEPYSAWLSYALEFRYVHRGDWQRAIEQHNHTTRLDPDYFFWDLPVGIAYREQGQYEKSLAAYRRIQGKLGGRPLHGIAITYARMGRIDDARRELHRLETEAKRRYIPPEQLAMVYANLGDNDRAMQHVERAYETNSGWLLGWAQVDPSYEPLRSDPRFREVLARLQLN